MLLDTIRAMRRDRKDQAKKRQKQVKDNNPTSSNLSGEDWLNINFLTIYMARDFHKACFYFCNEALWLKNAGKITWIELF